MLLLIVVFASVLCFGAAQAWPWSSSSHVEDSCEYSKNDIYICSYRYVDLNHDNVLTRDEMQAVIDTAIAPLRFLIDHAMGGPDRIIKNCGPTGGNVITRESYFEHEGCMGSCTHRTLAVDYYCKAQAQKHGEDFDVVVGRARRTSGATGSSTVAHEPES